MFYFLSLRDRKNVNLQGVTFFCLFIDLCIQRATLSRTQLLFRGLNVICWKMYSHLLI